MNGIVVCSLDMQQHNTFLRIIIIVINLIQQCSSDRQPDTIIQQSIFDSDKIKLPNSELICLMWFRIQIRLQAQFERNQFQIIYSGVLYKIDVVDGRGKRHQRHQGRELLVSDVVTQRRCEKWRLQNSVTPSDRAGDRLSAHLAFSSPVLAAEKL